MDLVEEVLHERIGQAIPENALAGGFIGALTQTPQKPESLESLAGLLVPAMHNRILAAWTCYSEFLREIEVPVPFDMTKRLEQEICLDLLRLVPELKHVTSTHTHEVHSHAYLKGLRDGGHGPALSSTELRQWVFDGVGKRVLDAAALKPMISKTDTSETVLWGNSTLVTPIGPLEVDVERVGGWWTSWRTIFSGGYTRSLGPLPFPARELQLLLGSGKVPDGITREILDTAFFRAHRANEVANGAGDEGNEHLPIVIAAAMVWGPMRGLLDDKFGANRSLFLSVIERAVAEVFDAYVEPTRRFNTSARSTGEPGSEKLPDFRPDGTPLPSLPGELPSYQIYKKLCQIIGDNVQSPDALPGAEEYADYVAATHIETCFVSEEEYYFLPDVALRIGVMASTVQRWIRDGTVSNVTRFRTGKQRSSFPVFSPTEVRALWLRAPKNEAFAEILGIDEQLYASRTEKLRKFFPGLTLAEQRALLLRYPRNPDRLLRGELPGTASGRK